jgi:hypothetical protein
MSGITATWQGIAPNVHLECGYSSIHGQCAPYSSERAHHSILSSRNVCRYMYGIVKLHISHAIRTTPEQTQHFLPSIDDCICPKTDVINPSNYTVTLIYSIPSRVYQQRQTGRSLFRRRIPQTQHHIHLNKTDSIAFVASTPPTVNPAYVSLQNQPKSID